MISCCESQRENENSYGDDMKENDSAAYENAAKIIAIGGEKAGKSEASAVVSVAG